ncbi:MAG TPA: class I SAM-dependent methyltransferase [Ktedonobacterales bacterium]|nr:class I SAM-dependent methyltransferase [Ktedonobacterales bacterium]
MAKNENSLMITAVRATLTRIGARITSSQMYWIERVISQLEVGRWFRANGYRVRPLYTNREQLYTALARGIADERALYLEFGVFQGDSLRIWSRLLRNPLTQLHGFDSFEGLPEKWNAYNPEGKFDVQGALPRFDDPRVVLHQGWFNETLPGFALPPHERLIVHIDADLYSSAKYVLDTLKDAIRPGTFVLFDEFYDRDHELRAFSEFLESTGMKFRFLGGATQLSQCAFERVS